MIKLGVCGATGRMGAEACRAIDADPDTELLAAIGSAGSVEEFVEAGVEVVVDFTVAEAVRANMGVLAAAGINAVIGTSGLGADDLDDLRARFVRSHCVVAPNFAVGAVLMTRFAALAAPYFDTAEVIELHHDRKVDAPSGTAMVTVEAMAEGLRRLGAGPHGQREPARSTRRPRPGRDPGPLGAPQGTGRAPGGAARRARRDPHDPPRHHRPIGVHAGHAPGGQARGDSRAGPDRRPRRGSGHLRGRAGRVRRLSSPGWIASHIFALAMVVLMVNLGFWQLRRLDERRADNAEIAAAISQDPFDIAAHLDRRGLPPEYTAVAATGTYLADAEVRIGNRSSGGQPGFWLATPLKLDDGRAVAVVRGWIPRRSLTGLDERSTAPPAGEVVVVGLAFDSVGGGRVAETAPTEVPEISRMDLDRFAEVSGVDVEGVWIRLRAQSPPQPEGLPEPVPDPDLGDGPHLSYAFQWFFFSAGAIVVYGLILHRVVAGREEAPGTELQL